MNAPAPIVHPPRLPMRDPYAPPGATIGGDHVRSPLYSPLQVAAGAFVGGPVGLAYFLWSNFRALGKHDAARWTAIAGALLMVLLCLLLPVLPERMPSWPVTLLYMVTGRYVAERFQLTKDAIAVSADHDFQSSWKVFGIGVLCLIASLVLLIGPLVALAMLGVWDPLGLMQLQPG